MKPTRTKILKVRVTDDEFAGLAVPLNLDGKPQRNLSRLIRARLFAPRQQVNHPADCQRCRLLASAVNNLNVIARRALDVSSPQVALEVIAHLAALEREIRRVADTFPRR